jgi:hypothetical protein
MNVIEKERLKRIMVTMVSNPAVKVSNLNDQDTLNKKVLYCLINALQNSGVSIADAEAVELEVLNEHAVTLTLLVDECIKIGNDELDALERLKRGVK